ncbi:hypothetical protein [Providencia hangzhouensis]
MDTRTLVSINETFDRLEKLTDDELFDLLLAHCNDGIGHLFNESLSSDLVLTTNVIDTTESDDIGSVSVFNGIEYWDDVYLSSDTHVLISDFDPFAYMESHYVMGHSTAANDENYAMAA